MEKATFAAGCFWGIEEAFRRIKGVKDAIAGYCGGHFKNPTYHDVCTGATSHAEAVEVTYDSKEVSYETLLDTFWSIHNPTTLNRQGPDVGSQYRSVIFYHTPEQQTLALQSKEALDESGKFPRKIVTEIMPAQTFWKAEEYHQQYLRKQGLDNCHI